MLKLYKIGFKLQQSLLQSKEIIISNAQIRCLFSRSELGVEGYERARKEYDCSYVDNPLLYKKSFKLEYLDCECSLPKFEFGVKSLIHVIEKNENDIDILRDALSRLIQKYNEYDGNKYCFGTVIMRAFYFLDMPNEAIEFFDDEILGQLFTQATGHQVLLDLLYERKMYAEVLRIYKHLNKDGQLYGIRQINTIIFATFYRLNTIDALKEAYALWNNMMKHCNKQQLLKCRNFFAGLAVKQNHPQLAVIALRGTIHEKHSTVRHIYLLAWAQLRQFDKLFKIFQDILQCHEKFRESHRLTSIQVLDDIEKILNKSNSKRDIDVFQKIRNKLESLELVTTDTLDDMLCMPFPTKPPTNIFFSTKKWTGY